MEHWNDLCGAPVIRYWMDNFPAHFSFNAKLSEAMSKFQSCLIEDNFTPELVCRLDAGKVWVHQQYFTLLSKQLTTNQLIVKIVTCS